jgi:hypothetical protein
MEFKVSGEIGTEHIQDHFVAREDHSIHLHQKVDETVPMSTVLEMFGDHGLHGRVKVPEAGTSVLVQHCKLHGVLQWQGQD